MNRNQPDHRGRGGYSRQPYGGHFSRRGCDPNERHWRDGNRDGQYSRRDQFQAHDNYARVHYAGIQEQSHHDAPAPKYSRQADNRQSQH